MAQIQGGTKESLGRNLASPLARYGLPAAVSKLFTQSPPDPWVDLMPADVEFLIQHERSIPLSNDSQVLPEGSGQ